jgi:predicted dehydrogenase
MLDMRLNANVNAAKAVIDSGRLGEIHAISFGGQHPLSYGTRPNWYFEQGKQGGTINDIAIHGLDAIEYMTGHAITELTAARTWNAFATFAPVVFQDAAQGMFALDNKCGVMFDVSYFAPEKTGFANPFYWRFTIWGRNGVLEFNYADAGCKLYLTGAEAVEVIPAATEGSDYLKIFTQEITTGADLPFGSEHIMDVSEKCLKLQVMADKNR